jgi:hypothetical protein
MSKKDDFVRLVQTAAIVESLSRGQEQNKSKPSEIASIAVHCAMKVDENRLPKDLSEACAKHIEHIFDNSMPKPDWLIGII